MTEPNFKVTQDLLCEKWKRFVNYLIDYVMQIALGFLIGVIIVYALEYTENYDLLDSYMEENRITDYIFGAIILFIYYSLIEGFTKGRSIGKYITKTKVVLEDGSDIGFSKALLRSLCRLIPFNALSFLGAVGKGWHDSISDTYVVDVESFNNKKQSMLEIDQIGKE